MSNTPEKIWAIRKDGGNGGVYTTNENISTDGRLVEYIRADLVPQWMPIDTAPKDGQAILSTWPSLFKDQDKWFIQPVFFRDGIWLHLWDHDETMPLNPTHWQPLPNPPPAT